jgi:hypothetical protein
MKSLLLKALLAAIVIGPLVTFVVGVARIRTITEYEPGISESEMKAYENRTVAEFEAHLQSRQVRLTRYQSLRELMRHSFYWKGLTQASTAPCIAVFLGCVIVGKSERRYALETTRAP